jgi:hypothetical protein
MITATEARRFSGETVEEKVEKLSSTIEKLAKENKRCLVIGLDYKDDEDLWIIGGYIESDQWKKAKQILENCGYKVSFYCNKCGQLFAMYTFVEW